MSDLTAFLYARLDEDEAVVAARPDYQTANIMTWDRVAACALVSPARVLADVQAKRRIVRECRDHAACGGGYDECSEAALLTLRHLAAVYAEHPEYRDEWRP